MKQIYPWESGTPLLTLLRAGAEDLPDESLSSPGATGLVRFVSGAADGITLYNGPLEEPLPSSEVVPRVLFALRQLLARVTPARRLALYQIFLEEALVKHRQALGSALLSKRELPREKVRREALWLIEHAAHCEPMKLGILLLGHSGTEEDRKMLLVLARYDELTLYAAEAACALCKKPSGVLWEMAKNVEGWGKIHAVERLAPFAANDPEIRAWLLRHGCQNGIMPEYLAHTCATTGKLAAALAAREIDRELLDGACLILNSLDIPGPDWEDYPEGISAVLDLLRHLREQSGYSLKNLYVVYCLELRAEEMLSPPEPEERPRRERLKELGWSEETCRRILTRCQEVFAKPEWPARIRAASSSGDEYEKHLSWLFSQRVGLPLWEKTFARLRRYPLCSSLYQKLLITRYRENAQRVVDFAEQHLLLEVLGAQGEVDQKLLSRVQRCLSTVLLWMEHNDTNSDRLLSIALKSRNKQLCRYAVHVLRRRAPSSWGEETRKALALALHEEGDEELREKLQELSKALMRSSPAGRRG